jgi:hypothetical protein
VSTLERYRAPTSCPAQQPDERRYFAKDVLRVGDWHTAKRSWTVTRETLLAIARNWRRAVRLGIRIPVVWNHSHDVRDQLGEVTRLFIIGDVLYAGFWVARSQDLHRIGETVHEVSIEVAEPWIDGAGRVFDIMLTHVGIVNHPVIPAQGRFHELYSPSPHEPAVPSAPSPTKREASPMSQDASPDTPVVQSATVGIDELVTAINELFSLVDVSARLSEDTTWDNLLSRLRELVQAKEHSENGERQTLTQMRLELRRAEQSLEEERERVIAGQRRTFEARVDELVRLGKLAPARRAPLLEAAEPARYSLSLLAPIEDVPSSAVAPIQRIARSSASPAAPSLRSAPMSDDRARALARLYREGS